MKHDLYLIGVKVESTDDHSKGQYDSYKLLLESGATDITWHSTSSNLDYRTQRWCCMCSEEVLCILRLSGAEIITNVSDNARITAREKIETMFDKTYLNNIEISESDIVKIILEEARKRGYVKNY